MAKYICYTREDENGDLHDYDVTYTISKAYGGSWEQPPEDAEITIISIQHEGVEIEDIHDSVIEDIEQKIWNDQDVDGFYGDLD